MEDICICIIINTRYFDLTMKVIIQWNGENRETEGYLRERERREIETEKKKHHHQIGLTSMIEGKKALVRVRP